ncbi:sensor histidine kinase [Clostridium ganghwense]|uniref:histidine kinase n=1 Tax=Clostridium ganghwense TaxID=312089 RepID=A0ABT4CNI9_9CLOT|nr:HAMP domain-containing sensor histidine kinase [Clostridium ganghwense]MCY6370602.1 HAMP domain-containing sensor histidine kinase [Clostridium ganghwense]
MGSIIIIIIAVLVCILVILFSRRYVAKMFDFISSILEQILSKNDYIEISETKDSRESKLAHQAKSIIGMINNDVNKTQDEKELIKELIGDISHQIKTPLANICMYTDILLDENLSQDEKREFLMRTKEQSEKINWLMKSLLKMSRLETGAINFKPDYEYIKETIARAVSSVYSQASDKNIKIEVEEFEDIKLFHNRKWTCEAITNILENTIKYSPQFSNINIKIIPLEIYTKIEITDQGIGIDKKDYNKIFKRFYRSENVSEHKGMGIGLYLSQFILSKEGGYITVKSTLGKGSTFSVFLQSEA